MTFPKLLADALKLAWDNPSYDNAGADFTPSSLLKEPHHHSLSNRYTEPFHPVRALRRVMGTTYHALIEQLVTKTPGLVSEVRLCADYAWGTADTIKLSAQLDLLEESMVTDIKSTTVYSLIDDKDHIQGVPDYMYWQVQMQLWLLHRNGTMVHDPWLFANDRQPVDLYLASKNIHQLPTTGAILFSLRDWVRKKAFNDPKYPQSDHILVTFPMCSQADFLKWLNTRLHLHLYYNIDNPTRCSDKYTYYKPSRFSIRKRGAKRASKNTDSLAAAEDWIHNRPAKDRDDYNIDYIPSSRDRCAMYCEQRFNCTFAENPLPDPFPPYEDQ